MSSYACVSVRCVSVKCVLADLVSDCSQSMCFYIYEARLRILLTCFSLHAGPNLIQHIQFCLE